MTLYDIARMAKKRCECGHCDDLITIINREGKLAKYKQGHYMRIPENRIKIHSARGRMENHVSWKGGRRINSYGYVMLYIPGHHRAQSDTGYVLEHIVVMEEILGRRLVPGESVHHINGNTQDNSKSNLMLFPSNAEHHKYHWRLRRLVEWLEDLP